MAPQRCKLADRRQKIAILKQDSAVTIIKEEKEVVLQSINDHIEGNSINKAIRNYEESMTD